MESVPPEKLSGELTVAEPTTPVAPVMRRAFWSEETVRLVVEAVEMPVMVLLFPVSVPPRVRPPFAVRVDEKTPDPAVSEPMVAALVKKFVLLAVVAKKAVEVAPVAVMFWKPFVPVKVLFLYVVATVLDDCW